MTGASPVFIKYFLFMKHHSRRSREEVDTCEPIFYGESPALGLIA